MEPSPAGSIIRRHLQDSKKKETCIPKSMLPAFSLTVSDAGCKVSVLTNLLLHIYNYCARNWAGYESLYGLSCILFWFLLLAHRMRLGGFWNGSVTTKREVEKLKKSSQAGGFLVLGNRKGVTDVKRGFSYQGIFWQGRNRRRSK